MVVPDFVARAIGSRLSGAQERARLLILIYHRILSKPDPLMPNVPDAATFDWQMALLAQAFRPCRLDEAIEGLRSGMLPARSVCVTFDDGYADNFTVALPILRRHGVPATIFVAPGFLDGGRMWNDTVIESIRCCQSTALDLGPIGLGVHPVGSIEEKRHCIRRLLDKLKYLPQQQREAQAIELARLSGTHLPEDLMLTSAQVKALKQRGVGIGAHTMSHPILAKTPDDGAVKEVTESKSYLEGLLGEKIELFAYPNGYPDQDYGLRHVSAVRAAGFTAAVSVAWGYADAHTDSYQLPRIGSWDRTPLRFALRLWRSYLDKPARVATC